MNRCNEKERTWDVLLIGGASGTGKTSVSYDLARHFNVGITEVDDLYIALEALTTPEQHPLLHYWQTNPDAAGLSAADIVELHISVCRLLAPAIKAVVNNHIETKTPIVLDGDYILPEMIVGEGEPEQLDKKRVKGIFLYEPDEKQILRNFTLREPEDGEQIGRAHVSWLFGEWLKEECQRVGLPMISARPWSTVQERIKEIVSESAPSEHSC